MFGVNKTTVAEHVFALILSFVKNIIKEDNILKRKVGKINRNDLSKKTIGILGTGNIGKEVIKRALAFDMKVVLINSQIITLQINMILFMKILLKIL